jgi:diguanylate cyclase (GGDEF)-like protein/PAS domain S-box-containing protein
LLPTGLGPRVNTGVLATLIDSLPDAVWIVVPQDTRIVMANAAAAQLLGQPLDMLLGRPATDFSPAPEDVYFWADVAAGPAHPEQKIHSETLLRHADGRSLQVERRVSPLTLANGDRVYVVALRDLGPLRRAEDRLELVLAEMQATLESTVDGILVCSLDGVVTVRNRQFAALWDLPDALLDPHNDAALYAHMARVVVNIAAYQRRMNTIVNTPLYQGTDMLLLRSGRILERVTRPQISQGRSIGRVYSFRDITERVESEAQLQLAGKVFESSLDAIFIADAQHQVVAINPGCERLSRCSEAQCLGRLAPVMFHDTSGGALFDRVQRGWHREGHWDGEALHQRGDGTTCVVHLSWVALRDAQGVVTQSIGFFKDLTEKKASFERIEQLAYSDALTGLPNRLMLSQRVDFALRLAERDGGEFAILFLDLDRFKNINDSLGHLFGDRVLVEVGQRMLNCLRQVDTLCRLGGDEFVMYLHQADAEGAKMVAQRVLESLAQPFHMDAVDFSVGCSIGVAMYPADGKTLDDMVKSADTAMNRVKERGRGSFRFYQPQMNVALLSRMKMEHSLRQAMDAGRFRLHYQPQVSLATGAVLGVEALIRWTDPELGPVSPGQFIPVAEESGFIVTIGTWVLSEAVRQAAVWQRQGTTRTVSVNVSALQFQQGDFVDRVASALAASGLDPALLELELTESILVQDADEALARLRALAALGVTLSIDDFGTGYSSLAYLKKFPIHKLKIDRSFISGLPDDESDQAIVSAIIQMGRALKLTVIAEGVETTAQRDALQRLHCDQYQGFLCAPGVPSEELDRVIGAAMDRMAAHR